LYDRGEKTCPLEEGERGGRMVRAGRKSTAWSRDIGGTQSGRFSSVRNMETLLWSSNRIPTCVGVRCWQADRKRGGIPQRDRMSKKLMPVAERQQETRRCCGSAPSADYRRDNWPDTGPGGRACEGADVDR
jgi:hypothetical protein